jgi:carbon monoxide dehydrogenase subunit G
MNKTETWTAEHRIETSATPEALWEILCDVSAWRSWNPGVERSELEGPFVEGTWFTMQPPGQDLLRSQLLDVRKNQQFVDKTVLGDLVVTVDHRIEPLAPGRTAVTYAVSATGQGASEIGPAVASDFPEVLASLAKVAEGRQK